MIRKFNLALFMWDDVLDAVLVERSVLGPEIRLSERRPRSDKAWTELCEKIAALEINDPFVTVSIPRQTVLLRTLGYPAAVKDNLTTMLPLEANRHLPLPEEDRTLAWATAEAGADLQLQMIAAKQSVLTETLAPLLEAGLHVDYALPASAFISRATNQKKTLVLIHDTQHTEVCLCADGLIRESVLLQSPAAEQIMENAQRLLARHHGWLGDEGVEQIISAGPVPISEELQNQLSVAFGLSALPLNHPDGIKAAEPLEALLAALDERPESLNLTQARSRKFSMSRRAGILTALAALLLTQLIAWPILYAQAPRASESRLTREIRRLKKQSASLQQMKTEIRQMRDELGNLEKLSQDQLSMMQVLQTVSETLPEDSYLTRIQFSKTGDLKLSGLSKNAGSLSGILLKLPFVEDIVKSENKERSNSEYSDFTINFTVKDMNDE